MKAPSLFLSISSLVILTACASTTAEPVQPSRAEVQEMCAKHYVHIKDEFTRTGKIKACMRARNVL